MVNILPFIMAYTAITSGSVSHPVGENRFHVHCEQHIDRCIRHANLMCGEDAYTILDNKYVEHHTVKEKHTYIMIEIRCNE